MKQKITKTFLKSLTQIENEIEKRFFNYINEKDKELNQKVITIKITKKKTMRALPLSLDKPTFRLFINKRDYGIFFKNKDTWLRD